MARTETDLLLLRPLRAAHRAEGLRLLLLRPRTALLSLLPAPLRPAAGLPLRRCPDLPSRPLLGLGAGLEPCTDWELGTPCLLPARWGDSCLLSLLLAGWGDSWPPPLLLTWEAEPGLLDCPCPCP